MLAQSAASAIAEFRSADVSGRETSRNCGRLIAMLIAQITDLHIRPGELLAYGRVDTAGCLQRAVAALLALDPLPDVVLATGDLVDGGEAEEYARLRQLLAPIERPLFVVPGNHDARRPLFEAFGKAGFLPADGRFLHYAVEDWPVRLIGLDTIIPGEPGGRLCAERLGWLDDRLAEQPERPTLLFMHHPPIRTGIGHMDTMGLADADRFAAERLFPAFERAGIGHNASVAITAFESIVEEARA